MTHLRIKSIFFQSQYQLLHALVAHYCKQALENAALEDKEPEALKVETEQPNGTTSSPTPSPSKSSPSKKSEDGGAAAATTDMVANKLSLK